MRYATDPLTQYLRGFAERPYALGEHDCVQLVAGWAAQVAGIPELAGKWRGYRSKARALRDYGAGVLELGEIVQRKLMLLGWQVTDAPEAGDIAAGGNLIGIWCGQCVAAVPENQQLTFFKPQGSFAFLTYVGHDA